MKAKGMGFLLVAMLAGLAAVVLGTRWLQAKSAGDGNRIAVAAVELQLGSRIAPEAIRLVEWPSGSIPAGAFHDLAKLDGRVAITGIQPGEPVLESRLAPEGTKGGLSAVVPEGKRAITVRVNDVIGVAGFTLPGNYVDIMVNTENTGANRNSADQMISKIVLERILVLAVAQEANRDETKPKVVNAVTLEVTPEQAERLDLARSVGNLSLVLRNQIDSNTTDTAGITKAMLLRTPDDAPVTPAPQAVKPAAPRRVVAKPPAPAPKQQVCVEVIRGVSKVNECF
ncbi:pilus assembly transmembrane protein [Aromatoleum aromaticum EbN1]|uniref:Pilus assembly transmembrane protein n=1 Tax=Aromatoleum aromaticum (strain DSM 19018 / LMG 30748 / EbN1) TaxID=76114 RepID=Q5P397_AROAE|nr:Flp pilus assembly protein CpaB [Aromatoleum aromaticum]CAI08217.1 pilus assembly transmembrane protein [Aromatoleum aromaticum EbN1]